MNEEMLENEVKEHETRINDHAERLREIEKTSAVLTARIEQLCKSLDGTNAAIKWLIGTIAATLISFFVYAVQVGAFGK